MCLLKKAGNSSFALVHKESQKRTPSPMAHSVSVILVLVRSGAQKRGGAHQKVRT
jgi:hypothetical protein